MTPAARVQTAIELLDQIFSGTPAEKALTAWARRSRFAGSKDRAAIRDHVYDGLRRRRSALPAGLDETGRHLMLGLLHQDEANLDALFSGATYAPDELNAQERAALETVWPLPADLPEWIVPKMQGALGQGFEASVSAMRHRAPVFLRVNLRKISRDAAIATLQEDGVLCRASELADTALEVFEGPRKIAQSRAYLEGLVELQDASSQAAIQGLPLTEGMRVLDYCAGGGGKTLAMGGRVEGQFWAHDANPARLRDLPNRAERAGLSVVIADHAQLENEPGFDLVFCDVPCSGTGTWRRTPDAKWRFSPEDLEDLFRVQCNILNKAKATVKIGGILVYATCSVLREENEIQVEKFVSDNPGFSLLHCQRWSLLQGYDGFFIAHLTRNA
ncbi:RsmB/NOP family class I SAM-dependent RNA methyltransferase [uncultured Shimia sp.]|uniref:RsmB/NOP family class I SAM-dependent RNA methyltransferase n=1 Tax=uncultured Shimia sp. TaxID=573152 RepID=UPI002636B4FF|nr:RsmB/NOP family class I SAM-dependent RNA methyltransferase [uncultured Shimia sp.]